MKRHAIAAFFFSAALIQIKSAPPPAVANDVHVLNSIFAHGLSSSYRAQLMAISPSIPIDPPPPAESFESVANVTLTVDSLSCYESIIQPVLENISSSKWERKSLPGYPRANWRIVGPWGKTYLNFLIDPDAELICVSGVWYRVDARLVERMTKDFVEVGFKILPRNTPQPAPKKMADRPAERAVAPVRQ
jgi:hypothetical protein